MFLSKTCKLPRNTFVFCRLLSNTNTESTKPIMDSTEKKISIKAPWGNIAGLTWGDPKHPPVLLCHGKLDTCSGFRPLVKRLPNCFFYVSIDLPGNGRSDHLPPGVRYTVIDFVATIRKTTEFYKWKKFIYVGHSLGALIGKYYDIAYPGHISRVVELDPVPAHHNLSLALDREGLKQWYERYYSYYDDERYRKYNSPKETAPKYSYEQALKLTMAARGMTKESTDHVLERTLDPAGDGLFRFTYDQRMKEVPVLPYTGDQLRTIYTQSTIPTFTILARGSFKQGYFQDVPFIQDTSCWPNKNYNFKLVDGGHDIHIDNPECMAEDISKFLMQDVSAKL